MVYLQMFWEFFKTGLFSIGGAWPPCPFSMRSPTSTPGSTRRCCRT